MSSVGSDTDASAVCHCAHDRVSRPVKCPLYHALFVCFVLFVYCACHCVRLFINLSRFFVLLLCCLSICHQPASPKQMANFRRLNEKFLIVPKVLYFTLAMFFYLFHQFRSPFISHRFHVHTKELGICLALVQLSAFVANLYVAAFNDKSGRQRSILTGLVAMSALIFQTFFLVRGTLTFWVLFTAYFSLISATFPLLDKVVLDYLARIPGAGIERYGTQRVWGSIGYLVCNFVVESIVVNTEKKKDFTNMQYYNFLLGLTAAFVVYVFVYNLPPADPSETRDSPIMKLLGNLDYSYFIMLVLLCGIVRASMTTYLALYMTDVLKFEKDKPNVGGGLLSPLLQFFWTNKHATTTMCGVALEILIFFNSGRIIRRFGLFQPMFFAMIAQTLRFVGYYAMDYKSKNTFVQCCGLELLKGLVFGLIQSSAAILVTKLAPASMKTTAQTIYHGSYIALGSVLSGVIFGFLFQRDKNKPRAAAAAEFKNVYLVNIALSLITLGLFLFKYLLRENILFNRENAEAKLRQYEDDAELENIAELKDAKEENAAKENAARRENGNENEIGGDGVRVQ